MCLCSGRQCHSDCPGCESTAFCCGLSSLWPPALSFLSEVPLVECAGASSCYTARHLMQLTTETNRISGKDKMWMLISCNWQQRQAEFLVKDKPWMLPIWCKWQQRQTEFLVIDKSKQFLFLHIAMHLHSLECHLEIYLFIALDERRVA